MVININGKPLKVEKEDDEKKPFDPFHMMMTTIAFGMVLWVLDLAGFIFLGIHPFPFVMWIGKVVHFLANIF